MDTQRGNTTPRSYRRGYAVLALLLLLIALFLSTAPLRTAYAAGVSDLLSNIPAVKETTIDRGACGIAAATMVLDYYLLQHDPTAQPINIATVAQYVKEDYGYDTKTGQVTFKGTRFDLLEKEFVAANAALDSQVGVPLQTVLQTSDEAHWFSFLTSELNAKRPVMVAIPNGHALRWDWDFGHYIVVSGYTSDGSIIYHDPWDGGVHTLPKDTFAKAWGTLALGNSPWWYMQIIPFGLTPSPGSTATDTSTPPQSTPTDTPVSLPPTDTPVPPPPTDTPVPPTSTLIVNPTFLDVGNRQPPCVDGGDGASVVCTIVLSSDSSNQVNVDWVASYTSGLPENIGISPYNGTLGPGQQVTIVITFICAYDGGTIGFYGQSGEVVNPAVVNWSCA
jgi:hypothetical protein